MGGSGSGRQWGCGRATVEDGLSLDIDKLIRDGNIRPEQWCSGTLRWTRVSSGEEVGSISYEANLVASDQAWLRLHYRANDEPQDYRVILETTRPNYGGRRWWFRCPVADARPGTTVHTTGEDAEPGHAPAEDGENDLTDITLRHRQRAERERSRRPRRAPTTASRPRASPRPRRGSERGMLRQVEGSARR